MPAISNNSLISQLERFDLLMSRLKQDYSHLKLFNSDIVDTSPDISLSLTYLISCEDKLRESVACLGLNKR